jgi:hypothetical protein
MDPVVARTADGQEERRVVKAGLPPSPTVMDFGRGIVGADFATRMFVEIDLTNFGIEFVFL